MRVREESTGYSDSSRLTSGHWEGELSADVQPNKDFVKQPHAVTFSSSYWRMRSLQFKSTHYNSCFSCVIHFAAHTYEGLLQDAAVPPSVGIFVLHNVRMNKSHLCWVCMIIVIIIIQKVFK